MEGFPQSGGYAYSVIVGFLGSCPYPGWQHHNNTMSVYTAISSLKNHSGEPVVASGYFVDKCVWVWVLMYIWYYVQVYVCCVSMSSLVFNTMYSKSMCYLFCLYPNVKHVCMQVLILLSFSCECPVFDSLCVEFMDVCLILCHCNILSPPVLIVRSIFSSCMYVFVRGWVCLCVCVWEKERESVCGCMFTTGNNIVWWSVAWFILYCGLTKPANMHPCWMPHPKAYQSHCVLSTFWWPYCLFCSAPVIFCLQPSLCFCLHRHSSLLQIILCAHLLLSIYSSSYPKFVCLPPQLLNLQLCSLYTSLTCYFLTLLSHLLLWA